MTWMMALVEQPIAIATAIAFSNGCARQDPAPASRSSQTMSTMRRPACGAHADMVGVGRRNGGCAGQRHADRLGDRRHGAGRAHGHAMCRSERAMPAFDAGPLLAR